MSEFQKLRVLDLFSGIGGFSLGLERTGGFETVAFCEIEDYPRRVLKKHWPDVPIFEDVRELKGEDVGPIDVICGGYPCQPFSVAGKRAGQADDRHLWPEFNRLIRECSPTWVIAENVVGHISMGIDEALSDMEGQGYTCWPFIIPACALNADHRRDRVWIMANTSGRRPCGESERKIQQQGGAETIGRGETVSDTPISDDRRRDPIKNIGQKLESGNSIGARILADSDSDSGERIKSCQLDQEKREVTHTRQTGSCCDAQGWWPHEPGVGRVADGVPDRAHRIKALGNAVVPQIPEIIGRAILETIEC